MNPHMKRLSPRTLALICATLWLTSCCNEDTYEVTITGVESRALVTNVNNSLVAFDPQDPINKEDLFIEIDFIEQEQIVSTQGLNKVGSDVPMLEAAVVPCEDQIVIYKNRVVSVKVEVLDVDNPNARIDVTDQLVVQNTQISIADYVLDSGPGLGGFVAEFTNTDNLPDSIAYEVAVTLDDGGTITASAGPIDFN